MTTATRPPWLGLGNRRIVVVRAVASVVFDIVVVVVVVVAADVAVAAAEVFHWTASLLQSGRCN